MLVVVTILCWVALAWHVVIRPAWTPGHVERDGTTFVSSVEPWTMWDGFDLEGAERTRSTTAEGYTDVTPLVQYATTQGVMVTLLERPWWESRISDLIVPLILVVISVVTRGRPVVAGASALAAVLLSVSSIWWRSGPPLMPAVILAPAIASALWMVSETDLSPRAKMVILGLSTAAASVATVGSVDWSAPLALSESPRWVVATTWVMPLALIATVAGFLKISGAILVSMPHTRISRAVASTAAVALRSHRHILVAEVADRERDEVGRHFHATVLPELTALAAALETSDPSAAARLRQATERIRPLIIDRVDPIDEHTSLVEALEWMAELAEDRAGVVVTIDVTQADDRPPRSVERACYRIAQLALSNATEHGEASNIWIRVGTTGHTCTLDIEDDGRGVAAGARRGIGIIDMRARAAQVQASTWIADRAGGGTAVRFRWVRADAGRTTSISAGAARESHSVEPT